MRTSSILFLQTCLAAPLLLGQDTSSISGLITDTTGAAVPNASVKLVSVDQGWSRTSTSDDNGLYGFETLKVGRYEIHVDKTGFQPLIRENIDLNVAASLRVDLGLTVGDTSQTIRVTSESPILDTETANKQVTFAGPEVLQLPLESRSPVLLSYAQSGVVNVSGGAQNNNQTSGDRNLNRISFNGGRDLNGGFLVDGISVSSGDARFAMAFPSIEATEEVQVIANSFDVRYGKTDGAVVSIVTKSGSNQFHGAAFEYFGNDVLNANDWASNRDGLKKDLFQQNQFGGSLGGPLWREKHLFFFGSYEGLREAQPFVLLTTVPTALERQGDFSQTYNPNASLSTIYNPFSTTLNSQGQYIRTPFPNNMIPSPMFDSVGAKVANLYPQPNTSGDPSTHANNFAASGKDRTSINRLDVRFDWAHSDKYTVTGHVSKISWREDQPLFFGHGSDHIRGGNDPSYLATIENTYVISPTWVLNATVASSRWRQEWLLPSIAAGVDGASLGLPSSQVQQFAVKSIPGFSFKGFGKIGYPEYLNFARQNQELQIASAKNLGAHTVQFGFSAESNELNDTDQTSALFGFDRGLTSGPIAAINSSTSGSSMASLLLGTMASASAPYDAALAQAQKYDAWYVQDSWKATRQLTVQVGLRYDIQFPRTERYNRFNYFDFQTVNPLSSVTGLNVRGGLVFRTSSNRNLWNTDYSNAAPRVGVAYKLTDKLVIRSGFGMYYVQTATSAQGTSDGYSANTTGVTTQGNAGFVPANLLSNPFPGGLIHPAGASQGLLTDLGTTVAAYQLLHPTPYVESYNANVQYQLTPNSFIELGYLGSQGRKLQLGYGNGLNINQLNPSYLNLGTRLDQQVSNPFYHVITSGPLSGPTIPYNQLLRPYPQFTAVYLDSDTPAASSSYSALTLKYRYRFNHGLSALVTYQWSKAIDNTSETQGWETGDQARNVYDLASERSVSAHDVPQYLTVAGVWDVPVGRGRQIGSHMSRVADWVLGSWQVSTVVRVQSGLPLQFSCDNTLAVYGFQTCQPIIASLGQLANVHRTLEQWFNTSPSVISAPTQYTIGNAPRYIPNERWAGYPNADLSLKKIFAIREKAKLIVQVSAYNLSNTPVYGQPDTNVSSSTFGQITGVAKDSNPRNVEFAARIQF